jgi:hypothetical protein
MALNVAGLTAYVDETKMGLIKKMVLGARTLNYFTVQPDIKSSATINIINSDLVAQAGACGWNEDGETILTQRQISVCDLKINESICLNTLEQYYTQKMMNPGSYNEDIPFEGIYAEEKADKIATLVEDLIWKGDSVGGSGNLALCDGMIYKATYEWTGSSATVDGNTGSVTAVTANNIIAIVDAIVAATPADILDADDLVLFVGYDWFRLYSAALRNANLFHYTGEENQGGKYMMMIPGTNVLLLAVRGLNNTNKAFLSSTSNLYFGTDLLSDSEDIRIFYSQDNDEVRTIAKWKQGVQVAFPEFVVYFTL